MIGPSSRWKFALLFVGLTVCAVLSKSYENSIEENQEFISGSQRDSSSTPTATSDIPSNSASLIRLTRGSGNVYRIHVAAIHIDKSEFPLSKLLFKLTLQLALDSINKNLEPSRVQLTLSVRNANTCSRQFAGAVAAEEYYTERARLFVVSGCDAAIRSVSRLASGWRVPVLTAAGFGLDLNDKSIHRTLIRVAFSLQSAVEFLVKILKSFQWRRVNLIVDESDPNSLALKQSIERLLIEYNNKQSTGAADGSVDALSDSFSSSSSDVVSLNTIPIDLQMLTSLGNSDQGESAASMARQNGSRNNHYPAESHGAGAGDASDTDKWPNSIAEQAIHDALRQSSMYSRVNILLIPQNYLRKFMLSVYDQGMANGLYTFINMPLLLLANEDQAAAGSDQSSSSSLSNASLAAAGKQQSYFTSTGKNVFIWREKNSPRNAQAKQAFESLMSIYLRTPTSKAYVYFASKLSNFANIEYAITPLAVEASNNQSSRHYSSSSKNQLSIDPYSASFYDCLQVYAVALQDSLLAITAKGSPDSGGGNKSLLKKNFHAHISDHLRNRRFDNMVTGTILINQNGDRDTEYTLDDLNQMTGKFSPVILYKSENRQVVRLSRIQWSSDDTGE